MHKSTGTSYTIETFTRHGSDNVRSLNILKLSSLIKTLKNKGLVTLSEHILDSDFIYFVRPFYKFGNAVDALKSSKINQLNENELRDGARALSFALSTIHTLGYLHGDVRP